MDMAHVILHPHLSEEDSFTKTDHKLMVSLGRPSLGRLHGGWVKFDFYVEKCEYIDGVIQSCYIEKTLES